MRKEEIQEIADRYQEEISLMEFKPFKVVMILGAPIAFTQLLMFDGLLAYCSARKIMGDDFFVAQGQVNDDTFVDMPIPVKRSGKEKLYYCCSVAQYKGFREFVVTWKKRWDDKYDEIVNFGGKKEVVNNKAGHFKSYNMPMVCRAVSKVWFYVYGNKEETLGLLRQYITHVGKGVSQGYGKVINIRVEDMINDYSCIMDKRLMRPIPQEELAGIGIEAVEYQMMAYRPPYWLPANFTTCGVPS